MSKKMDCEELLDSLKGKYFEKAKLKKGVSARCVLCKNNPINNYVYETKRLRIRNLKQHLRVS